MPPTLEQQQAITQAIDLIRRNQPAAAVAACERVMSGLMKNPDALRVYAMALVEHGQFNKSVATIDKAIKLRPMDAKLRATQGKILSQAGRFTDAVDALSRLLALHPKDTEALDAMVQALRHLRRHDEAARAIESAIKAGAPEDGFFAYALAEAARGATTEHVNEPNAIATARRVLDSQDLPIPLRAGICFRLGALLERAERFDEAFSAFDEANNLIDARFNPQAHQAATGALLDAWNSDNISPHKDAPDDHHVFIVGMPRSGTTLVEQILAANPDAATAGETMLLPAAARKLGAARPPFQYATDPDSLTPDELIAAAAEFTSDLRTLAGATSESATIDKLPINAMFVPLAAKMFPNARFIGCRRDPRDVALSCYQHFFTGGNQLTYDLEHIAHFQADTLRAMDHWAEILPDRFEFADYEETVADINAATQAISDAAGLEFHDNSLRFWETDRRVNTASYDQVSKPVYSSSVGRWKHYSRHLAPVISIFKQRGVSLPN